MPDAFTTVWHAAAPVRPGVWRGAMWGQTDPAFRLADTLPLLVQSSAPAAATYRWAAVRHDDGHLTVGVRCSMHGRPGPVIVVDVDPAPRSATVPELLAEQRHPAQDGDDQYRIRLWWQPQPADTPGGQP